MGMKVSSVTSRWISVTVGEEEVDLPIESDPSPIMNYMDPYYSISPDGGKMVIGYLVDDRNCEDPLTDSDANGRIYTRNDHRAEFDDAFRLDRYGEPDIDEDAARERYVAYFLAHGSLDACRAIGYEPAEDEGEEDTLRRVAEQDFDDGADMFPKEYARIRAELWREALDPLMVPLDVYEHGGISYSLSGEGMQDRFDTSRCGAVWVPDTFAREQIEYAAIQSLLPPGTSVQYVTTPEKSNDITYSLPDGRQQGGFERFADAIKAAAVALSVTLDETAVSAAMRAEAIRYARDIARMYTEWRNGETYGVAVNSYTRNEGGEWEITESMDVYGFIGQEWAEKEMHNTGRAVATWDKLATNEDDNDVASPAP